jgi:nitrous oxide reductase accessory protein NosL
MTNRPFIAASAIVITAGLVTTGVLAADPGQIPIQCFMCGMKIHAEGNLHVKFVFKDGAIRYVDDLGEVAKAAKEHKDHISKTLVFDHGSGKAIPADKAFALVGSKFKPAFETMSPDVVLFYEKKADAQKAAKKHGGKVTTFDDALKAASKAGGGHGGH